MADETTVTPAAVNAMVTTAFPGSRATCVELDERFAVAEVRMEDKDIRPGGFIAGPTQFAVVDAALWFLVFGALGRAPEVGDTVTTGGLRLTVVEIEGSRIMRIEVEFGVGETPTDEPAAA